MLGRGGVEDTRLEAKAKDTKKIRGQGQGLPFRGQTLSRARTGMLEAKAKDQGHKRKCSPKKKKKRSPQKFFKRSPQKNVFQKIFQALHKILTIKKILLSSSRGQANFRGLEASRPRPRTSKCVLEDSTSGARSRSILVCKKSTARRPAMRGLSTGLDRKNSLPTLRKAAQAMLG